MIGPPATVCPDRDPDQGLNGKFSVAQITGLGNFRYQLVESRINIIGKLNLHDRFYAHSAHPYGGPDNISFLDSRIEDPVITEFFSQGGCLPENAAQPPAYVLSI